jgi:long-chain fatty acid transport protein
VNSHWNLAFKYEAPSKLKLKNSSRMNAYTAAVAQTNAVLGQFADGRKVREDIPAILGAGAKYSPVDKVRLMAGWHFYFDKQAKKEGDKQDLIDKGTIEFSAGAEYDVLSWLTVSGSWQCTRYRLSDAYMNDLSFNVSSNAIGLGVRVKASERCNIDLAYMHNFYHTRDVETPTKLGAKFDHYYRRNRVLGVGVNLKF